MDKYNQPPKEINPPANLSGWQCPICGAVYSPFVSKCNGWHGSKTISTNAIVYIPDYSTTDAEKHKR